MFLIKYFLVFLILVFSYVAHVSSALADVSLDGKVALKTLTIEDFEEQIRELNKAKDPKKVIKLKYGVPEILMKNNSVINLDTLFTL